MTRSVRMRGARAAIATVVVGGTAALGGCALITSSVPESTPSAIESCALGKTWALDTTALQAQLVALFAEDDIAVSEVVVDGTETLTWTTESHVTIDSDYTVRATAPSDNPDAPFVVTQRVSGTTTGRAYFSDVVAVPRNWDASALTVETTAVKGADVVDPVPFSIPTSIVDDVAGLEVTCTAEQLTTHPRNSHLTLTWTPAG